jgi:predicted AAA+ superfamily ATPase
VPSPKSPLSPSSAGSRHLGQFTDRNLTSTAGNPGVLHAAAGGFDQPLSADWDGVLLEHLVLHELRAYMHYHDAKGSLGYWATPSGGEVDFVWWRGSTMTAIEVKAGRRYRKEYWAGIRSLEAGFKGKLRSWIVYRGTEELKVDRTRVLPLDSFLRLLHGGEIIG